MGIPVALGDSVFDANRMEPGLISERHIKEWFMILLQLLDGGQVEMVVMVVADDDDIDARQFVQFARRGCESFGSRQLTGAASVREDWVEQNVHSIHLYQEARTKCFSEMEGEGLTLFIVSSSSFPIAQLLSKVSILWFNCRNLKVQMESRRTVRARWWRFAQVQLKRSVAPEDD